MYKKSVSKVGWWHDQHGFKFLNQAPEAKSQVSWMTIIIVYYDAALIAIIIVTMTAALFRH